MNNVLLTGSTNGADPINKNVASQASHHSITSSCSRVLRTQSDVIVAVSRWEHFDRELKTIICGIIIDISSEIVDSDRCKKT